MVWGGVLATLAAMPSALAGYVLGYHSSLPIFGGGLISVLVPAGVVWAIVFAIAALRSLFLSLWPLANEGECEEKSASKRSDG